MTGVAWLLAGAGWQGATESHLVLLWQCNVKGHGGSSL